jgi:hypothetical protein
MTVDKETYLKIKNEKPNEVFLNQCREETKMFRKPKDNFQKIKEYIIQEKDKLNTGDTEQWVYEKILFKIDEIARG